VIAPLALVQTLLGAGNKVSSIEMSVDPKELKAVTAQLENIFGSALKYENRQQQNATFYGIMAAEKWAVYFILLLVLLIASFNLVGALSMLILEKQKDIAILRAMGATRSTIRSIFLGESLLWSTIGGVIGIALGALLCAGQQHFEWIKLEGAFLINAYPVALQWGDVGVVFLTAVGLGLVAGILPAWRATKEELGILR
jgi:lipoprotein-releasing system permease protein